MTELFITIKYDSSWHASFLDGSNNAKLPLKGRKYSSSMKSLREKGMDVRPVSHDTVMGLLNRFIGDPRKLYVARECENYYFADLERHISFEEIEKISNEELIFLRNLNKSYDPFLFCGTLIADHPHFTQEPYRSLLELFFLDFEAIRAFIRGDRRMLIPEVALDQEVVSERLILLKKMKPLHVDELAEELRILKLDFPSVNYVSKDKVYPNSLYCAAFYINAYEVAQHTDLTGFLSKKGVYSGLTKKDFQLREFFKFYSTKGYKKIYGNPFTLTTREKGVGVKDHKLPKSSGNLVIKIAGKIDKLQDLKNRIEDASVGPFCVGKKGLAYIDKINFGG